MASRDVVQYRTPLRRLVDVLSIAFLVAFFFWTVLPLFVMFVSSFKDLLEAFQLPQVGDWSGVSLFFSFTPTIKHYLNLFVELSFGEYLMNSLLASLSLVTVQKGISASTFANSNEFPREIHDISICY